MLLHARLRYGGEIIINLNWHKSRPSHYMRKANSMLTAGADVRTVAGRLGHRNPSTNLNVYSHSAPQPHQQAAAAPSGQIIDDAMVLNKEVSKGMVKGFVRKLGQETV
jgi:integrase